jgi:hypothetical protein
MAKLYFDFQFATAVQVGTAPVIEKNRLLCNMDWHSVGVTVRHRDDRSHTSQFKYDLAHDLWYDCEAGSGRCMHLSHGLPDNCLQR